MVTFKFSFGYSPVKSKERKKKNTYTTIISNCEGLIVKDNETFKVNYKGKLYSITGDSYNSKGKKCVYCTHLDKYHHRIKIIRDVDCRYNCNKEHYIPFAEGLMAKGRIVKAPFSSELFHIVSCYSLSSNDTIHDSLREWKEFEETVSDE